MKKITVDSQSFVGAIQWATKSFDTRDDRAFVALTVNNEAEGFLSHMNPTSYLKDSFIVYDVNLDGDDELFIALQGQYITRLAASLDTSGPSELTYSKGVLKLKNKLGNFTLPTFTAKPKAEPTVIKLGEVENASYFDALQRLAKLCDPAIAQLMPVFGAVDLNLNIDDEKITLMATDRFALGEISLDFTPAEEGKTLIGEKGHMLLPYEAAVLIPPLKGAVTNTEIVYEESGNKFGYLFDGGRVALFALKNAEPIAYGALKTKSSSAITNSVSLETKTLQKAIGVISSLSWDEVDIFFEINNKQFIITDTNRNNKLEVELEVNAVEGEYSVKFVRSVINEAFAPIATSKMNLKWNEENNAFILEAVLDDGTVADNIFVLAITSS